MGRGKDLSGLGDLRDDVLNEVIREGERRLDAQLATANAVDQRSMAWVGFLISVSTVTVGGSVALLLQGQHILVSVFGLAFAASILRAAMPVMDALRPKKYSFPGNCPENWLREEWHSYPTGPFDMRQARVEEAVCINNAIHDNAEEAENHARDFSFSMTWTLYSVVLAIMAGGGIAIWKLIT